MSIRAQQIIYRKPPWHRLIDLQGHQGVLSEWGDFPPALLQITQQPAEVVPCGRNGGCYMNVIRHDDTLVGICTVEPRRCDRRALSKEETAVYRLNAAELFRKVAEAVYCHLQQEVITGHAHLWKIGYLNPQADYRFSVYAYLGGTANGLIKAVNLLAAHDGQPFLLISTVGSLIGHAAQEAAQRSKSKVVGLDDILDTDAAGAVIVKNTAAAMISAWVDAQVPKNQKPGSEYIYPTPPGARWEEFVMEFSADEVINVSCRGQSARLDPEHFKMKNQRNSRPTAQWAIFKALAVKGEFTWSSDRDRSRVIKQKQEFSEKLKATFQMNDDPLEWNETEYVYKPRFIMRGAERLSRTA